MSDWLHNLPVVWMTLVVFGFTYLVAAAIYALVNVLAVGERARSFKVISPGLLPPLGIIFALFVAFTDPPNRPSENRVYLYGIEFPFIDDFGDGSDCPIIRPFKDGSHEQVAAMLTSEGGAKVEVNRSPRPSL